MVKRIDFQTDPSRYRHWRVAYDGAVATIYSWTSMKPAACSTAISSS